MPAPGRTRLAVMMLFMINGLIVASWIVRIPDIKAQLRLTDAQLGLALFGAPAGVVLGQQLVGWMLPRWGSRRMAIVMTVALCIVAPWTGLAPNLLSLLLVATLLGCCGGGMDVAMRVSKDPDHPTSSADPRPGSSRRSAATR